MAKKILVLGAAFIDVIVNIPRLPESGEDITGDLQSTRIGGSAFNVQRSIDYCDVASELFIPVGQGVYADLVEKELYELGVSTLIRDNRADNGWDISLVEKDGERTFLTVNGIEQMWVDEWFSHIEITDYDYFYVSGYQLENKEIAKTVLKALSKKKTDSIILFDASPRLKYMDSKILDELLSRQVIIHCNEDEILELVQGAKEISVAAETIGKQNHSTVVVTLGGRGSYVYSGGKGTLIPGENVDVINTIGAGDTHSGGLLAGLSQGLDIFASVARANQLSAQVVQQEGGSLKKKLN